MKIVTDEMGASVQENVSSGCQVCESRHHKALLYLGVSHELTSVIVTLFSDLVNL